MADLISRQAAIDALHMHLMYRMGTDSNKKRLDDWINGLPSAQPIADVRENVRGEWIEDNSREKSMMWRCSVCGRIAYYPTIGKRKSYKKHCGYNYCPNCGADMR